MECLLIGGAQSVGKSESIYRLTQYLVANGFLDVLNRIPPRFGDFRTVLEGIDSNGKPIRIIINTPTDTTQIIQNFKTFFDSNGNYDIFISSVRDDDFWPRHDFFKIMGINTPTNQIIEIPLAKITRKNNNFNVALKWYQDKMDSLLIHTLKNSPFNI